MPTFCKQKSKKKKCKKRNLEKFEAIATHQCARCHRLACAKKRLCKPQKR